MIEILVMIVLALASLAKHTPRKRRKFRRYVKGSVDESLQLGTLGARTLITDTWDETVIERTLITSIDVTWSLGQFTPAVGDGPIIVGVAHSDYTDAEIEEVIENSGSWNEGAKIEQERSKRQIRIVGSFFTGPDSALAIVTLNDGKPIHTKLNWILVTGQTLKMFAYNAGSSPLATTDPRMTAQGFAHLWPQ